MRQPDYPLAGVSVCLYDLLCYEDDEARDRLLFGESGDGESGDTDEQQE